MDLQNELKSSLRDTRKHIAITASLIAEQERRVGEFAQRGLDRPQSRELLACLRESLEILERRRRVQIEMLETLREMDESPPGGGRVVALVRSALTAWCRGVWSPVVRVVVG
jgi:hypothetical protein